MPLLKINGMTLKVLPDIATPKMPLTDALRSLLPPAAAEYQEKWQLDFFGYHTKPQMIDGFSLCDFEQGLITANPRMIQSLIAYQLETHIGSMSLHFPIDWLGKKQFPDFDDAWDYKKEPKNKCSCGRCHITFPSAQIKRTKKAQKPEIRAYELAA